MDIERLRAQGDSQLTKEILQDSTIQQALRKLSENDMPLRVRRHLLATAVRLTPGMSPALHDLIKACRENLEVTIPIETYVYASPQFNAVCIKPEEGRLFIALSSSLLDQFDLTELKFVLGHELGHSVHSGSGPDSQAVRLVAICRDLSRSRRGRVLQESRGDCQGDVQAGLRTHGKHCAAKHD